MLRAIVFAAVAAILTWQVTTRSLVSYLAGAAPETALSLRSNDPRALLNLAVAKLGDSQGAAQAAQPQKQAAEPAGDASATGSDEKVSDPLRLWAELAAKTAQQIPAKTQEQGSKASSDGSILNDETRERIRTWTELALAGDPLNARAPTILGELALAANDEAAAGKFFRVAAQRSIHERMAVYWMMQKSYESRDYAAAVFHADALLRTLSQASRDLMPLLVQMAETKDASEELKKVLLNNPPWRSRFLSVLSSAAADPRTTLDLLLALRNTSTPPTAEDVRNVVRALIVRKQYDIAYYAWLEYLPPEHLSSTGFLFNGSFELTPSGVPFDWLMGDGPGVTVEIADHPERDGQRALLIEFGHGRVEFPGLEQLTMLAPGNYRFKASQKGELIGKRGLVWRITCAHSPVVIGESAMALGTYSKWRDVEFAFTVPATDCRAQQVRLLLDARMASEQLVTGSMWYDEVRIVRADRIDRPQ